MANVGRTELMESVARRHDIAVSIGRRKVSSARLEDLVSDHDLRWKELCDMQRKSENSKKDIREQIDKWELEMIGRIRVKADQARDKLAQLTDIEANTVIDKAQGLTREMNTRDVELDVLKDNLEQLKESTDAMKKVKEQFIKLGNIELYTEPHHMIDWNHLIYVRKQSITAAPEKERVQTVKDNYTHQDAAIDDDELDEKPTPTRDVASANSMTTYERWRDRIPGVTAPQTKRTPADQSVPSLNRSTESNAQPSTIPKTSIPSDTVLQSVEEKRARRPLFIHNPIVRSVIERSNARKSSVMDPATATASSSSAATSETAENRLQTHLLRKCSIGFDQSEPKTKDDEM